MTPRTLIALASVLGATTGAGGAGTISVPSPTPLPSHQGAPIVMSKDQVCRLIRAVATQAHCVKGGCFASAHEPSCLSLMTPRGGPLPVRVSHVADVVPPQVVASPGTRCFGKYEVRKPPREGWDRYFEIVVRHGADGRILYRSFMSEDFYEKGKLKGEGNVDCGGGNFEGAFFANNPETLLPYTEEEKSSHNLWDWPQ